MDEPVTGSQRASLGVRATIGVAVPLVVLAVALGSVDPLLVAGAVLTLGSVFTIAYAYARFVDDELAPDGVDD